MITDALLPSAAISLLASTLPYISKPPTYPQPSPVNFHRPRLTRQRTKASLVCFGEEWELKTNDTPHSRCASCTWRASPTNILLCSQSNAIYTMTLVSSDSPHFLAASQGRAGVWSGEVEDHDMRRLVALSYMISGYVRGRVKGQGVKEGEEDGRTLLLEFFCGTT
ncbi:hypothetical protein BDP81DRAFT_87216 [Colletotrichum phormii]|uniref:Uncharacterized protein n=1 Tax=Colletotrichum phormii TaxID=359342 RepID=A0AAJ0A1I4_9PEZI|nr:uncharacterized protein BDP81DRAFT_87216 [Colletotrichum phormii]KAK1654696.1 hypothetical protein BDP81DRAFT_87216 [Colletotrichum phormii]